LNGRGSKRRVHVRGESIAARFVDSFPRGEGRAAYLKPIPATEAKLPRGSLDGVFTDPPYFDNVQYAELMDFCFSWLRLGLRREFPEFRRKTTRATDELTGNVTLGRGLEHFTEGLSAVFRHYGAALKPGAPLVFTYHHNDPAAYVPLVVAILDADLNCTATLPAAAEMSASLHIARTGSSILDSVFVCRGKKARRGVVPRAERSATCQAWLSEDAAEMRAAGLKLSRGDLRCLATGHIARLAINTLARGWSPGSSLPTRMERAERYLGAIAQDVDVDSLIERLM